MNKNHELDRPRLPLKRVGSNDSTASSSQSPPIPLTTPPTHLSGPTVADARITSLKVLVLTLLSEIESLQDQVAIDEISPLNLQEEVHRFEAALIRVALLKTGGRQRKAARLLGTKVTTLNAKIKRYAIDKEQSPKS